MVVNSQESSPRWIFFLDGLLVFKLLRILILVINLFFLVKQLARVRVDVSATNHAARPVVAVIVVVVKEEQQLEVAAAAAAALNLCGDDADETVAAAGGIRSCTMVSTSRKECSTTTILAL